MERLRPIRRSAVVLLLAGACLGASAAPASADPAGLAALGLGGLPGLLLPANPLNSDRKINPGFDLCANGAPRCPYNVIREMYERWRPLNARCDHRAVFALTYLRTTEQYLRAATAPGFFEDGRWVVHEDANFAEFYFRAYDDGAAGREVPPSWKVAFDTAGSDDETGIGDLLLGMNAHINRDLSFTLASVGLVKPGGGTRKTDHDKVNEFLAEVADPLQEELGRRYDPMFSNADAPGPLDEGSVVEIVRGLREQAWRNAEQLVNASGPDGEAQAAASVEAQSQAYAESIRSANTMPGYGATRDAWCRAHLEPSFSVTVRGKSLRKVRERGTLRVHYTTDGPADAVLRAKLIGPRRTGAAKSPGMGPRLTIPKHVRVGRAGRRLTSLRLTPAARRLLSRKPRARIKVVLRAPRGMRARGVGHFGS